MARKRTIRRYSRTERALHWVHAGAYFLLFGLRHGLRETIRELERFDGEDLRWLFRRGGRPGRFNAGQKLNAIVTAAFALLFAISGFLLWYGERDTRFRLANTILLHDGLMYAALMLLAGHLYLSLVHPSTRHALRGMIRGTVDAAWAVRHHPRWAASADDADVRPEGRNGKPERLVEDDRLPVLGDARGANAAPARDRA
jgi:formate dehydrogenase subunit gamma